VLLFFLTLSSTLVFATPPAQNASDVSRLSTFLVDNHLNGAGGGWIAFYSGREGNNEIFLMNADGTSQTRLTYNDAHDECPSVSRNGKVVFVSERNGNRDLFCMDLDGSQLVQLTHSPEVEEHPQWSADGERIFFVKDFQDRTEIWVMNADGSQPKRLTQNACRDERPMPSPDDRRVLFMSNRFGNYEVVLMDSDGRNQRRVTNSATHKIFPVLSPDGCYIAYSINNLRQRTAAIHVMLQDGSRDVLLTPVGGRNENPCWSFDGTRLVFQSERDGNFEIYAMNVDGSGQTRLTGSPSWDGWASWVDLDDFQ